MKNSMLGLLPTVPAFAVHVCCRRAGSEPASEGLTGPGRELAISRGRTTPRPLGRLKFPVSGGTPPSLGLELRAVKIPQAV